MGARTANAMRVQRSYERRKLGTRVFNLELDEVALTEALTETGILDPSQAEHQAAIEQAAATMVEMMMMILPLLDDPRGARGTRESGRKKE